MMNKAIIRKVFGIAMVCIVVASAFAGLPEPASAATVPTVETRPATLIATTAAMLNGRIVSDGGASITERRFSWGTTPSCSDGWTSTVGVSGDYFSYYLMGLNPGTTYYFQAWARNSVGWANGAAVSFTTQSTVIAARIDSYYPNDHSNPARVAPGSSVSLSVTFTNTGNTGLNFIAGTTIWDSGGAQVANYHEHLSNPLQPNQQTTVYFSHTVSQAGDYWVQFGVWKAEPFTADNLLDKEPSPSQRLIVGEAPPPTISYSPSSLSFIATQGSNPSSQTLGIRNSGGGTLNWSLNENATWLNLSTTSGSSTGEWNYVTLSVSSSSMNPGSYNTNVTILASGATNSPQTVPVSLKIQCSLSTSISPSGSGSVSPSSGTYDVGTQVTLTAIPSSGWRFDHWGGSISGSTNPITITMDSNKSVTAYFVQLPPTQYSLNVTISPSGSGSVSLNPAGGTYNAGTAVTLTATPNSGWAFDHWGGDASGTSPMVTVTMNANKNVTAYFVQTLGTISVTSNVSAPFSISGPSSYSGTTPWSISNAPAGTYTITWGSVSGYTPPQSESKYLSAGGSVSFYGNYQQQTTTISGEIRDQNGALAGVEVELNGPTILKTLADENGLYIFSGTAAVIPSGTYSIIVRLQYRTALEQTPLFQVLHGNAPVAFTKSSSFTVTLGDEIRKNIAIGIDSSLTTDPSILLDRLDDLAAIYRHSKEVIDFEATTLNTVPDLDLPMEIHAFVPDLKGGYYSGGEVYLGELHSQYSTVNRPMNREWHELFHELMDYAMGLPDWHGNGTLCAKDENGDPVYPDRHTLDTYLDCNHDGNLNHCTSDSWVEGWAEFWSCVLWDNLGYAEPHLYRMSGMGEGLFNVHWHLVNMPVNFEDNWKAWDKQLLTGSSREEFAVASLLWDLYDPPSNSDRVWEPPWQWYHDHTDLSANQTWQLFETSRPKDMKDVYDALRSGGIGVDDSDGDGFSSLDELFIMHGFFADTNENHRYDTGEEIGRAADRSRPSRRNTPGINNAYLLLDVESGQVAPLQNPILVYEFKYGPPNEYLDFIYETTIPDTVDIVLAYFEPSPADRPVEISVYLKDVNENTSDRLILANDVYWESVETSTTGYALEHTFEAVSAPPDATAPATVSNLAVSSVSTNSVILTWTAPGDDANIGTASQYDIRYSTSPITDGNWNSATQCTGEPSPQPAGSTESFTVTDLSPNTTYYFALKTADEVPNWSAISNVVSGSTFGAMVAVGTYHTLGLKVDGTVVAVGDNQYGQCNVSSWTDIAQVAAGGIHTVGLRSDGTVVAVGDNRAGQCDVDSWTNIVQVAAGWAHTIGLKSDGTVLAAGRNQEGQCDVGGWTDIIQVAAAGYHTVGLKSDGTVVAVGWNDFGQCNVAAWTGIISVAAGNSHTVALKSNGTVVATGDSYYGQCNVGNWADIVQVTAGRLHTVGLKSNGTVVAVGANEFGQCNVAGWNNIIQVAATGSSHTVGLKADGTVVATGYNHYGECNVDSWTEIVQVAAGFWRSLGLKLNGTVVKAGMYDEPTLNSWAEIVQVAAGDSHTVGLKSDGTVVAAGTNSYGQCDVGGWTDIIEVAAGVYHTLGLKPDGRVVPAGWDPHHGSSDVWGWSNIVQVSAGRVHTVGLKADGTVVAVGDNTYGQLNIHGWSNIVQVSAGYGYTVGLKADGTVVAVGKNDYGQCDVGAWTDIMQVSANFDHTVGLKSDGTVVGVGNNAWGQCHFFDWNLAIVTQNRSPNRPSNTLPPDDGMSETLTPTLISSGFSDPDAADTHAASQWQIRTSSGSYSSPVFGSGTGTANLTSITIPSGTLNCSTTYYWRVRHQDNHGAWSSWSLETSFTTAASEIVYFPDPNLEAAIREAIGKPTGDIYQSDLVGLTSLNAADRAIGNLTGLEHCIGLTELYLDHNQVRDLSPLSHLTSLTMLYLNQNQINDLSTLLGLDNLRVLYLGYNQIVDVATLAHLIALTQLDLRYNQISDISPLSELTELASMSLGANQIDDLSPLSGLTNLGWLDLNLNQISDLSPLSELRSLTALSLMSNQISDVSPLSGLINLTSLDLYYNQISDVSPLAGLTNLTLLQLSGNQISNLSPLAGLASMVQLELSDNQISDIEALVQNPGLSQGDTVYLTNNPLSADSINIHIPQLQARGVEVLYDVTTPTPTPTPTPSPTPPQASVDTPTGGNVTVSVLNSVVTFNSVVAPGTTTVITQQGNPGSEIPSGFRVRGLFVDISTTATYTPPVTVGLSYDPSEPNPQNLKLFHWEGGHWVDVTTWVDTANHIVYGQVDSLSWFFIGGEWVWVGGAVPVFPNIYIWVAAAIGAAILAYFVRRRLVQQG